MQARACFLTCAIWVFSQSLVEGQGVRVSVPYDGQLRTDPDVGNVQGIQRYGRPLKTDPDQGDGFSYHVYPVANDPNVILNGQRVNGSSPSAGTFRNGGFGASTIERVGVVQFQNRRTELEEKISEAKKNRVDKELTEEERLEWSLKLDSLNVELDQLNDEVARAGNAKEQAGIMQNQFGGNLPPPWASPYPPAYDWTGGIRNFALTPPPPPGSPADFAERVARAAAVTRAAGTQTATTSEIYHQPLIQIKVRVVEVVRGDSFNAGTILEYVSLKNGVPTLTSGQTANTGGQNTRAISRLPLADLATTAANGTGTLVNLTTKHINGLIQLLATETNADVVTAPEVVTLNGQNVEFVSGDKLPFQLGQNVIQGTNNNIQQFFYKHVGTMVSVTPRIVNWGLYGEGQGEKPILANDILNWPRLVKWMSGLPLDSAKYPDAIAAITQFENLDKKTGAIPFSTQGALLKALNAYSRQDVQRMKCDLIAERIMDDPNCERCQNWKAEDCTIDVSVVVRLSNAGNVTVKDQGGLDIAATSETNVRAISNVIQLKSGHGVVMAGLIGDREIKDVAKVPVLGDMPVIGFLFRNKVVTRLKTEVLIFVEAQVLDPEPSVARAESSHDFLLGQAYVAGEFLDNPLEYGMYRVGFGSYLPPHSHGERVFWERFGRKVRKVRTHLDDAFE